MNHIDIKNLKFGYTSEDVIKNLDLTVEEGDLITIIGENGSGKSTLLKLMLGELKPDEGRVKILGQNVNEMNDFQDVGYVPQVQNFNDIAFPITVSELVVLNLYKKFGFVKIPKKKQKKRAIEILDRMGLHHYINAPYNELSGGLKQRAMIARAMINSPKLMILDEPTAGVDQDSKVSFLKLISKINREDKITIVIVTHEIELIQETMNIEKAYKMKEGKLVNVAI
ncbi:MAG: metal ABC transporter ATP-binding protein [Tissierellia bacterium]|nr:metal ABC transporter ATP-binding protein [Tissierellia bacterium]